LSARLLHAGPATTTDARVLIGAWRDAIDAEPSTRRALCVRLGARSRCGDDAVMIKRIHVNQHVIRRNRVQDESEPPLTVKSSRGNTKALRVVVEGPSEIVYSPDRPLACGARVWVETTAPVIAYRGDGEVLLP
jgi:hypothetical protein